MYAGKTTRLIELFSQSEAAQDAKIAIKPLVDTRYQPNRINTHSGLQLIGHRVSKPEEIFPLIHEGLDEVYLDEVQFFDKSICRVIADLNYQGIRVIAAGLNKDYLGNDFGPFPEIMKIATQLIHLKAKCEVCQLPAEYTYRISQEGTQTLIGGKESYQARCEMHWKTG